MNQLRQKGLLRYSRKGIQIYPDALREYLHVLGHQAAASESGSAQPSLEEHP
jgi:hypothetical protein